MGIVFAAEHVEIGRRVALKILARHLSADEEAVRAFREEARASARIGHDNIVEVYDFATLPDGRLVSAMELLDGVPLSEVLEDGPIAVGRTIAILRQLAKALHAAHKAGLVHRDVKPDNIMLLRKDGRHDYAKLLDFGIVSVLGATAHRSGVGTPVYMSPESILHDELGAPADLYSLGVTAYEMLTGRPPFWHEEVLELMRMHLDATPTRPSRFAVVPAPLEKVILRCLAKEPADRYESLLEFEIALCEAQIKMGLRTEWDDLAAPGADPQAAASLALRMPKPLTEIRNRSRVLALGLTFGLLASAGTMATWLSFPETNSAARQAAYEARRTVKTDELVAAAKEQAAKALYVYPPVEEPDAPTAYRCVLDLEQLPEDAGRRAAEQLRSQFADTLTRLGDEYWEHPSGQTFAVDYYIQALLFDATRERARERAVITPGELIVLRLKAANGGFTRAERVAAETLQALAIVDHEPTPEPTPRTRARRRQQKLDDPALSDTASQDPPLAAQTGEPESDEDEPDTSRAILLTAQAKDAAPAEAIRLARLALEADRHHLPALELLGNLYFDRADYVRSARFRQRAVRRSPRRATLRIDLGDALFKSEKYTAAHEQYRQAEKLGSTDAKARLDKVERLVGQN